MTEKPQLPNLKARQAILQAQHSRIVVAAAEAAAEAARIEVGDVMPDGSIYAGVPRGGGARIFAMPADEGRLHFNRAAERAEQLNKEKPFGHDDWRVPNKREAEVLYAAQKKGAFKGTFDLTQGMDSTCGLYWTSQRGFDDGSALCLRFNAGTPEYYHKTTPVAVRYIRSEPS